MAHRQGAMILALCLAGCATTPEKLIADKPPLRVYESPKAPLAIVQCLSDLDPGLMVEPRNGSWSVSNRNQLRAILINWYIRPKGEGSTIELRRTQSIAPGMATAERCF